MTRKEIAGQLERIAAYMKLRGENKFKVSAYEKAASALEKATGSIEELVSNGLTTIPGIGKGTASVIEEIVETGESSLLRELESEVPAAVVMMSSLRGMSAKRAMSAHADLGVETLEDLERVARDGSLSRVSGFGGKTVALILESIEHRREIGSKVLLPMALEVAGAIADAVRPIQGVRSVHVTGEVRRRHETPESIDIVVEARGVDATTKRLAGAELPGELTIASPGLLRGHVRPDLPVSIHVVTSSRLWATIFETTGSPAFLDSLTAGDDRRIDFQSGRFDDEAEIFEHLGLPVIPPERRELEASRTPAPEILVKRDQILGTFHVHTTWSDGKGTLDEMLDAAADRDLSYVGISDHSQTASYAGGLTPQRVRLQHAEIEGARRKHGIRIFRGTECDILPDGTLDFDDETLSSFDFVVASVHSRFDMPEEEMTERIISALENPWVTFLGHVSGRKLLIRRGYDVDYDRIFRAAAENGVMIEINGAPRRLDLDWPLMERALDAGVHFSIHPDAHSTAALDHVTTGVWNARRGGVPASAVFNTKPVDEVADYLLSRRERAAELTGLHLSAN